MSTSAGLQPRRLSPRISLRNSRTPGRGCARLLFRLEISGSTPPINPSCSPGNPATSSCVRRGTFWNYACSLAARSRLPRCGASIAHRNPSSFTSCRSDTETRLRRRSPTGFRKRTNCLRPWQRRGPNRNLNRRIKRPRERPSPSRSQSGGNLLPASVSRARGCEAPLFVRPCCLGYEL